MQKKSILLVMSPQRRLPLLQLLEGNGLDVFPVGGFRDARQKLDGTTSYELVFVASELPDGSWQDLLQYVRASKRTCELIVCSRFGDERLWSEVIQCGAFDLIAEPYEEREVLRIVRSALDSLYRRKSLGRTVLQAS